LPTGVESGNPVPLGPPVRQVLWLPAGAPLHPVRLLP